MKDAIPEEAVRVVALKRAIQTLRETPDVFWPNYLEEIRPNSHAADEARHELWAPGFVEENFPEAAAELKREREELARSL